MIRINLVPVKVTKKQLQLRQQIIMAVAVLLLSVVTVGWMSNSINSQIAKVEQNTADTQAKLKQLDSTVKKIESFKQQKAQLQEKLDVIQRLVKDRTGPVRLMAEIAVSKPTKLWLNDLKLTDAALEMRGIADAESTVIDFAQKLKNQEHISNVRIKELSGNEGAPPQGTLRGYVEFSLVTSVKLSS